MKTLIIALILFNLSGCAGLSINWSLSATYTSDVPLGDRKK